MTVLIKDKTNDPRYPHVLVRSKEYPSLQHMVSIIDAPEGKTEDESEQKDLEQRVLEAVDNIRARENELIEAAQLIKKIKVEKVV